MKKENKDKIGIDNSETIKTDPLGSWTGVPEDPNELPVQDVDDL